MNVPLEDFLQKHRLVLSFRHEAPQASAQADSGCEEGQVVILCVPLKEYDGKIDHSYAIAVFRACREANSNAWSTVSNTFVFRSSLRTLNRKKLLPRGSQRMSAGRRPS